jgi:hypothetical protein
MCKEAVVVKIKVLSRFCPEGQRKSTKTSVRIIGLRAEIFNPGRLNAKKPWGSVIISVQLQFEYAY